jgi:hypothetical protein
MAQDDTVAQAAEAWFLTRGLPHFIADYRAASDIWTRALGALTILFVAEVIGNAPNQEFPLWLDGLAVVAALGLLLAAWTVANRVRGRRPLARPDDLGALELAFFVVVPALVPLVFGGQVRSGVITFGANVLVLGAIYLGTSYGIVSISRWALGRFVHQIESVVSLLARSLPLIALLVTFLFLTTEVWQTAGTLHGPAYWLALALFPAVGTLFMIVRLPRDVGELNHFEGWEDVAPLVVDTPVSAHVPESSSESTVDDLGAREWRNVGLVALFSQGVQIFIVSVLIGMFFVVLGLLLVDATTTTTWVTPAHAHVLATLTFGNRGLVITEELLRVAGFLTAFSGMNFTVYLLTDETYRREFRDEVVGELRQAFAVRAVYRAHRASGMAAAPDGADPSSSTMSPT